MDDVDDSPDAEPSAIEPYQFGRAAQLGEEQAGFFRETAQLMGLEMNTVLRQVLPGFTVEDDGVSESEPGGSILEDQSRYDVATLVSHVSPCGILAVELPLGLAIIGGALGGATKGEVEPRPLTSIETRVLDLVMAALVEVASRSVLLDEVAIRRGRDTGYDARDDDSSEARIGFDFVMSGPRSRGAFTLAFDLGALQRFSDVIERRASGRRQPEGPVELSPDAVSALRPVPIDLSVGVGRARLTAREVVELREGDVIRTRVPVTAGLVASAGDTDLFEVRLGQQGSRLVAEILSKLDAEPSA